MYIEKLWEEKPELVLKAIKKIANIDEDVAKELSFKGVNEKGNLKFGAGNINGYCTIFVNDFRFEGEKYVDWGGASSTRMISESIEWMKFMYKVFGDKYAMQYISKRNQQLDKFMADYEEKYNAQTKKVLDGMGFEVTKGQTK